MYDELAVERKIQQNFSIIIDINKMITFEAPASPTLRTTIFLTKKKQLYAYIEGRASISNDRKQIEQLWTPTAEAWFNGYQDPQLRLLLVHGESADVWHNTHTATQQWWHITKKAVGAGDETPLHTKDHLQL